MNSYDDKYYKNIILNKNSRKKVLNTRCDQKIIVIFKFRALSMFDFRKFFAVMLVQILVILDCQFILEFKNG